MSRDDVLARIDLEQMHQIRKRGAAPLSVPGYLIVMLDELEEAIQAWVRGDGKGGSDDAALDEIRQVATVALRCLEAHGCPPRGEVPR